MLRAEAIGAKDEMYRAVVPVQLSAAVAWTAREFAV
jgi:hypothetical protein